jgi:hypothetical protein
MAARTPRARRARDPGPADRPFRGLQRSELYERFAAACTAADGVAGAHCIHELWMRGEIGANVERLLQALWARAAATVPDWLPMRHVEWLPLAYEVAARFTPPRRGRTNVYLVLLDYEDARPERHGVYVGVSDRSPAERFDQHKAGIRASGAVLKRGLEVLTGPVLHLQKLRRADALDVEERLAEALRGAGLFVKGGH